MKDDRPTRESDCYALGMVVYEVLSGRAPFFQCKTPVVIRKVIEGECPERPQGVQGVWFTDDLWGMLELCWKPQPNDRPGLRAILRCLEGATQPSRPLPPSPASTEDTETDADDPLNFTVTNSGTLLISHTAACKPSISHWNIVPFVGVYSTFGSPFSAHSGPGRVRPTDVSPIDQLPHPDIASSPGVHPMRTTGQGEKMPTAHSADVNSFQSRHRDSSTLSESCVTADAEAAKSLSQSFWDLAQKLRLSFPRACSWLGLHDLQDIGECAADGGRFADVWKARLGGQDVAIKSYRCYVRFDCDRVRMVSYSGRRFDLHGHYN